MLLPIMPYLAFEEYVISSLVVLLGDSPECTDDLGDLRGIN